jgi:hypothetical protein
MSTKTKIFHNLVFISIPVLIACISVGCNGKNSPSTPYDLPFSPTPTQIAHVYGPVMVSVVDKNLAVHGVTVLAIPPSGSATYSGATTTTGITTFNPPYLEVGNWTFIVPQQNGFPFAPSTITMPVSVANEQANFNSAGATIQMTPPVPNAYSSTSGGVFVYGLTYNQPGNLLVPVNLVLSSMPNNWNGTSSPATLGYSGSVTGAVTITGVSCVDSSPSFSVTGVDMEPTPYPRANSTPQTISKNFTSTVTVTWNTTGLNEDFCNNGNPIGIVYGNLTVSSSSACSPRVNVSLNAGDCCYSQFQTPNGNISGANCGGGSIGFGTGSYSCTTLSGVTWGTLTCTFNGKSNTVNVPTSGSVQILSANY